MQKRIGFRGFIKIIRSKGFLLMAIFVVLLLGLNYWVLLEDDYLSNHGTEVVGTIREVRIKNIHVSYSFSNQDYVTVLGRPFPGLEVGEKFTIKLDPDDNENVLVEFWNPVYESQDFATTKSTDVDDLWLSPNIEFFYSVNGMKFNRYQLLPPQVNELNSDATYVVIYKKANPAIAYIQLN